MYPPRPQLQPGQPVAYHGLAVLAYLLANGETYGLFPDRDLELAEHAAYIAVTAPEILPVAVDNISVIRHRIAAVLKRRAQEQPAPIDVPSQYPDSKPHSAGSGQTVPIPPPPPPVQPPARMPAAPTRARFSF